MASKMLSAIIVRVSGDELQKIKAETAKLGFKCLTDRIRLSLGLPQAVRGQPKKAGK